MKSLLKLAVGIFLALLTMELISLRVFNYEAANDPVFGRIMNPGHTVYCRIEGSGKAHYVEHGIRRKVPWDPAGPSPILVLGDSYAEAHQVNDDEVFTDLLEKKLKSNRLETQVLNLGVSGYSVADYVAIAPTVVRCFNPRWTIIQVSEDDFTTDAWKVKANSAHFETKHDGRLLVVSPSTVGRAPRPWKRWIANRFAIVNFFADRVERFAEGIKQESPLFKLGQGLADGKGQTLTNRLEYPIKVELELLNEAYGGKLTLLYIPDFNPREPLAKSDVERKIIEDAKSVGIEVVSIRSEYPAMARDGLAPFGFPNTQYNWGHWNVNGQKAAADLLTAEILKLHKDGLL